MTLYAISHPFNQTVLDVSGNWMSTNHSRSSLKNVCWFDSLSAANEAMVHIHLNTTQPVTAKTLCRKIGIRKIPSYVRETYRSSPFARQMKARAEASVPQEPISGEPVPEPPVPEEPGVPEEAEVRKAPASPPEPVPELQNLPARADSAPGRLTISVNHSSLYDTKIIQEIRDTLQSLTTLKARWTTLQASLADRVRQSELMERDILHIIEFYDTDACGIQLLEKLHEVRTERRRAKNEQIAVLQALNAVKGIQMNSLTYALGAIDNLARQTYHSRIMSGENCPAWILDLVEADRVDSPVSPVELAAD